MTRKSPDGGRSALFAGSFNPFTVGHASVVERALPLFDRIIIAVGDNAAKPDERRPIAAIEDYCRRFPEGRVTVVRYSGELTVDVARRLGADCLLRGVRSVRDFEYERDLADINRRIGGIETVLIFSLPEHEAVSSSMVRELQSYGHDVAQFLPDVPLSQGES